MESIRAGIAHMDPMYRGIARPYHLLLLAEAEAAAGDVDAAARAVEEALTIVEEERSGRSRSSCASGPSSSWSGRPASTR